MVLVTIFISIPFVIREVVPRAAGAGTEEEQAAWTLGASRLQTFFRVTLPNIRWGLLYGIALSAARAIGEVGAVLIVSGSHRRADRDRDALHPAGVRPRARTSRATSSRSRWPAFSIVLLVGIEVFKRREIEEAGQHERAASSGREA